MDAIGERPWHRWYDEGVPRDIAVPGTTLPEQLRRTAERFASRPGTVFFDRPTTYSELFRLAASFAALLKSLGVKPSDRVALLFPNVPLEVACYYGAMLAGATVVQINPLGTEQDMAHALKDSGARVFVGLDALVAKFAGGLRGGALEHVFLARIADALPLPLRLGYALKAMLGKVPVPPKGTGEDLGAWLRRVAPDFSPAPVGPEDLALLQYTGGTTGRPKAAMLTQRNLVANVEQSRVWERAVEEGRDTALLVLPFFHVYGMTIGMNLSVRTARTMVLHARWDAREVLRSIARYRPRIFPGIQRFYQELAGHPEAARYDLRSVEVCISGAGPLMQSVQEAFERLTGAKVVEGYGLTEASPVTHANPIFGRRKSGTIGLPFPSTDAKLVDLDAGVTPVGPGREGELCVKGPQVMRGYWGREEETRAVLRDGWLHTGDVAVMDEEGYFRIVDRKKEMIKSGGENVYPRDVEERLFAHPAVKDAAVIGVPDPTYGEKVKAFIVLKAGAVATGEELIAHCRAALSGFQTPKAVEFRAELPRTQVGKLLRRVLVEEERAKARGA